MLLQEKLPQLGGIVKFDPEGSMFCACSSDKVVLQQFVLVFAAAVEDEALIRELPSRAELE